MDIIEPGIENSNKNKYFGDILYLIIHFMVSFFTRNKPAPKDQNQSKATPETPSSQEAPADLTNSAATTHTTTTVGDMQLLNTV
jgi:hypothetical protein